MTDLNEYNVLSFTGRESEMTGFTVNTPGTGDRMRDNMRDHSQARDSISESTNHIQKTPTPGSQGVREDRTQSSPRSLKRKASSLSGMKRERASDTQPREYFHDFSSISFPDSSSSDKVVGYTKGYNANQRRRINAKECDNEKCGSDSQWIVNREYAGPYEHRFRGKFTRDHRRFINLEHNIAQDMISQLMFSPRVWIEHILPFYSPYYVYKNSIPLLNRTIRHFYFKHIDVNTFLLQELYYLKKSGIFINNRLCVSVPDLESGTLSKTFECEPQDEEDMDQEDMDQQDVEMDEVTIQVGNEGYSSRVDTFWKISTLHSPASPRSSIQSICSKSMDGPNNSIDAPGSLTIYDTANDKTNGKSIDGANDKTMESGKSSIVAQTTDVACTESASNNTEVQNLSEVDARSHEVSPQPTNLSSPQSIHHSSSSTKSTWGNLILSQFNRMRFDVFQNIKRFPDLGEWNLACIPDKELLECAVRAYGSALRFGDKTLRSNRDIVMLAVSNDGLALQYAHPTLRNDREIVLKAVSQNGLALEFAGLALRKDYDICLAAVKQNGLALSHAFPTLRSNNTLVLAAIHQNGGAFQYADPSLLGNRENLKEALKTFSRALLYAPVSLREDEEILIYALQCDGLALQYFPPSYLSNRKIVMEAVSQNGLALQYASDDLRADREIVTKACSQDGYALEFVAEPLRYNMNVIRTAILQNLSACACVEDAFTQSELFGLIFQNHRLDMGDDSSV